MPQFTCQVCDQAFSIPTATLETYPGWEPKYCREHSPNKKTKSAGKKRTSRGRGTAEWPREEMGRSSPKRIAVSSPVLGVAGLMDNAVGLQATQSFREDV